MSNEKPRPFPVGKLPSDLLNRLLRRLPMRDPRVLIGPQVGEDAAVIAMGERCLIAKTDPITFATDRIGWYAVHINANDIAVMGGTPRWFLATVLLPERRTDESLVRRIFCDLARTCAELSITLCGGHTEITYQLDRPIIAGMMLGEAKKSELIRKTRMRPGDCVLLARGIAIEGTALIARERGAALSQVVGETVIRRADRFLYRPGISVLDAARTARRAAEVKAMHDPTEGGLLAALDELARVAGVGLRIDAEKIPVMKETEILCRALGLDPLRLIASGALLIVASRAAAPRIVRALQRRDIPCAEIGTIVPPAEGRLLITTGGVRKIRPPAADEITKIFSS